MIRSFLDRVYRLRCKSVRQSSPDSQQRRARLGQEVARLSSFEALEDRRVLAYGATVPGVFVGDAASDHLVLEAGVGGNLRHNLPVSDPYMVVAGATVLDPAFAPLLAAGLVFESEYDADGAVLGVQLFPALAVSVTNTGGHDIIEMIGIGAATVTGSVGGSETLRIHGSGGNDLFTITAASVTLGANVVAIANVDLIEILGSGGDDRVTLTGSTVPVSFDGGAGDDTLSVSALSVGGADFDGGIGDDDIQISAALAGALTTYSPGGNVSLDAQSINFAGIEEIVDLSTSGALQVSTDGAANAVTYAGGALSELTVDDHESYKFSSKASLTLDTGAGADTVDLVLAPGALALAAINVSGGDSDGDQLFVNGTLPTDILVNVGTSTITGAATVPATINYGGFEGLTVLRGTATGLSVSGSTSYEVNFGDQADAGTIQTDALPIHFVDFGSTRKLTLNGATIVVHGTPGDDAITLAASPGEVRVAGRPIVVPTGFTDVVVDGGEGDDTFTVTSTNTGFVSALTLQGAAGSDTINWATTATVTGDLDLAFEQISLQQNIAVTGGDVTLRGATTLTGNRSISTAGGDVTFEGPVDGAFALVVTAGGGDVRILDSVGAGNPLTALNVSNSGELLLAADLRTNGPINLNSAIGGTRLAAEVVISTSGGALDFGAPVNATSSGVESLTLDTGTGNVTLQGVGTSTPLGTFRVARAGTVSPGGMIVTAGGATIDLGGGTLIIDVAGFTLDATGGGVNPEGADVILADVNADAAGSNRDLTIVAGTTGRALLTGAVGGTRLDGLTITAGGGTELSGNISTGNGGQGVTFHSPVRLLANIAIDSGNGASDGPVVFHATVDGPFDLTIDANSDSVTFQEAVGGFTPLGDGSGAALTITEADGDVSFQSTVALASGLVSLDGETGFTFREDVELLAGDTGTTIHGDQIALRGLHFKSAGPITFGNAPSDTVTLSEGAVEISTAAGHATLTMNASVQGGQDLTIATGTGAAIFAAPVGSVTPIGDGVGAALTLASGIVTFQDTVATSSGIVATDAAQVEFRQDVTIAAGDTATALSGNVILDGLSLSAARAVTIGNSSSDQLTLSSGAVTISTSGSGSHLIVNSKVDGAQDLTLHVAGATQFNAPLGAQTPLGDGVGAAVTINSPGSTTFASTVRTASGLIQAGAAGVVTLQDNVVLGDGDTNTTFNANLVLDGLTLTAHDPMTIGDAAGDSLLITAPSWIVTSNDTIRVVSATSLAANLTIDAGSAGITLDGTVDGNWALSLNSTGTTRINGVIGGVTPIHSLTTNAGGITELNAGITAQGNTLTFNDPVVLISSLTITDAGDATFNSTLNGSFDLTLAIAGTTRFVGAVGAGAAIGDGTGAALAINSTGPTIFESTLATASGVTQADNAGLLTLRGDATFAAGNTDTTLQGSVVLDGLRITSAGDLTFGNSESDAVTLSGGTVEITTAAAGVSQTFNGRLNGAQDLIVDAGTSSIVFHASLGAGQTLGDGVGPALTITGADLGVSFLGEVRLASGLQSLDQATSVRFNENVEIAAGDTDTTINAPQVTLNGLSFVSAGNVTLGDSPADRLTLDGFAVTLSTAPGNATLIVNANVQGNYDLIVATGTGQAQFNAPIGSLFPVGDGIGPSISLLSGSIDFADTILTLGGIVSHDATTVRFQQNVTIGAGETATSLDGNVTFDGMTLLSFGAVNLGNELSDQILLSTGPVTLTTSGIGQNLVVLGKLDGAQDLTLNVAGTSLFAAPVGSQLPIGDGVGAAVTINSTGSTTFGSTLNTASGLVQADAAGILVFADNVTFGDGNTNSTLAGDVVLDGAVVTAEDPISLGNSGTDSLWITGMTWLRTSNDLITINSATILAADFIVDAGAGAITYNGTVDGNHAVVLQSAGTTTINGVMGGTIPIASLTTDSPGVTHLNASITAQGNTLTFNDPVVLLSSVTLTDAGNVTFGNTVDGAFDLTLNVTGTTRFTAAVGSIDPLGDGTGPAITINSTGPTFFDSTVATNSGIVQAETAGPLTLRDDLDLGAGDTPSSFAGSVVLDGLTITSFGPVNLGSDETDVITLSQGPVSITTISQPQNFFGKLEGSQNLTVDAGASSITLHASLGEVQRIGTGVGAALTIVEADAGVAFEGTVRLASGLSSVDEQTSLTFDENVDLLAGDTPTLLLGSSVTLNGMAFSSAGDVTIGNGEGDALVLAEGAVTLSTAAGHTALNVVSNVVGSQDLAIELGTGQAIFSGTVGTVQQPIGDGVGAAITIGSGTVRFLQSIMAQSGIVAGSGTRVTFESDVDITEGDTASSLHGDVTLDGMSFTSDVALALGDEATDQVTLSGGPVTITTSGPGDNLTVSGKLDGAQDLVLNIAGSTLFAASTGSQAAIGDGVGAAITINSTGTTTFGGTLATRSGLTQADSAGLLTFADNVTVGDGNTNTTLNAHVVFHGLTFAAEDPVTIGNSVADSLLIAGPTVLRTSGDLTTLNSATTLAANFRVDAGAGNIVVNGTVNGNWDVVLNSAGTTTINGIVGGVTPIASLTTDAPGTTQLNASITAQGNTMTFHDPVTLLSSLTLTDVGDVTFNNTLNGSFDLTLAVGGTTRFVGAVGAIAAIGDGTGPAITINSTGPTVFESTLRTGSGMTQAENAGLLTLRGDTIWGAGNTDTTLNGSVVLDGLTITAARAVNFGSDETDAITLSGGPVTVTTAAASVPQTYHGKVNGSQDLTVHAGASSITFHASLGETQRLGDGVGAALTITSATGGVSFHGPVSLASGLSSLDDATGVTFRENVDLLAGDTGTTINGSQLTLRGMNFSSAGAITFGNAASDTVTLADGAVGISTAAGHATLTINASVQGAQDLAIDTGTGLATFNAAVGNLIAIGDGVGAAITLVSGTASFESTVRTNSGLVAGDATDVTFRQDVTIGAGDTASSLRGDVTLDGLIVNSDGAIALGDAATDQITLSSAAVTITTSGSGDNLTVAGKVDGAQDLTLNVVGSTLFTGPVGSATPIGDGTGAALVVNSTGSTTFASTLNTRSGMTQADAAGLLTFQGNVNLGDGDTNTNLNANVVFDGLTFAADDPVTIGNSGADTLLIATPTVLRTSNDLITLNSATTLAANLIVDAVSGNIVINGTVNGNWALVLNSAGTTTINGIVGGVTPIASLTTDAPGTTQLNASITAQGSTMTFHDPVTLLSSLTLTNVGDVTFNNTLNGSFDLTLAVGGTTRFVGAVGAIAAIGDGTGPAITISSTGPTVFESTLRTGSGMTQAENAGLLTLRGDTIWGAGNTDTTLNGSVVLDGLTITAARAVNFGSDETDAITLSGGPVTVTTAAANVAQTYHGKVNGSQDLTVHAGASSITFHASLGETQRLGDGVGAALTITSATAGVAFHGQVNLASGLSSLDDATSLTFRENIDLLAGDTPTTINANALRLNGLTLVSAGNLTLTDDTTDVLTLDEAQVTITTAAAGTNVTVNGLVRSNDDGESTLVVDAGHGTIAFKAAIGDTAASSLAALTLDARHIELRQLGAAGVEGVAGVTSVNAAHAVNFTGTIYTANEQSYAAGHTFDLTAGLATTFTSSGDAIAFSTGAIVLANGSDLTINSSGGHITTEAIRGASSEDVTINSGAGNTSVGPIGNADGINTVTITGARITLNGNITTSNSAGNSVTLIGAVELGAPVFINTNTAGVDGNVTISGPGTVDGAHDFHIDAGTATITISGTIGAGVSTPLDSLDLDAATINLANIGTPTEAGVIHTTDVNATLALNFTGSVYHTNWAIYTGPAGLNLNVNAGVPTSFITSDDPLTFTTATIELANGSDLLITANGGAVSILAGIDGTSSEDVTISSTGGTVNRVSIGQIGTTTVNGINTVVIAADVVRLSGNITTSDAGGNNVTITGATELDNNIQIDTNKASSDGHVTFDGTVNGPYALEVNAGADGDVTFTGIVGGVTPLTSLTVSESNETSLVGAVTMGVQDYTSDDGFFLRGTFLTSAANVTFSAASSAGNVTLVDDTLISTGSNGGDILFGTDVDIDGLVEGRETLSLNAGTGNITLQTVGIATPLESLRLLSANNASILSPAAGTTYLVADIAADAESTSADNLLAVSFRNVTGTVTVNGSATGDDGFVFIGAKSNDVVVVTGTSVIANGQLFALVNFTGDGQANSVTIHGFDGDDTITVTPAVNLVVAVNGGNPDHGSDVLNFLTAVGPTTIHLGNATIDDTGIGAGPEVLYTGIETVNLDAGGLSPTIAATTTDDDLTITPYSADTGKVARGFAAQQSGQVGSAIVAPVVFYSNLGVGNPVVLDMLSGHDTVAVMGNASAQTIDVNLPAGTVAVDNASNGAGNDGRLRYVNNESLTVFGLEGSDTFNIAMWTTAPTPGQQRIPVMIDGGSPIGIIPGAVDTLNMTASGTAVVAPGPEADAGGILVTDNEQVSFDQIEAISIADAAGPADLAIVVLGTNGDDDITLQGVATNSYTVSVNDGPAVLFVGSNAVTLRGLSGDDDIDVDVEVAALSVAIAVHGDLPAVSGGDTLTVTGVDGVAGDAPTFTPTDSDAGTFVVAGTTITFDETELVVYDGETDNETLTINGAAGIDDVFHYIPEATADAGFVQVSTPTTTRVPLQFRHLGATGILHLAGDTGNDTIVQQGTNLNDVFTVAGGSGTIDLVSPNGLVALINHVDVTQANVEHLVIASLNGDDTINVNGAPGTTPAAVHPFATISVQGGEPSASDTLHVNGTAAAENAVVNLATETITGLGGIINYDGVEHVHLDTNAGGDTLTVNGTALDDEITYTPTGANSGQFFRVGENVNFAFADVDGTFTITGEAGESADQVNVIGTNSRDTITIDANTRVVQVVSLGANAYKAVTLASTVDVVSVFGRNGQDTFIVVPLLGLLAQPGLDNLVIYVDGGQPGPSDALVIASTTAGAVLPAENFVVVSRGLTENEGTIRIFQDQPGAGNNPFQLPDISYTEIEVVSPNVATTANGDPNLLVLGADGNEPNEFRANATFLGSGAVVQSLHASILPPAGEHPAVPSDQDFYRVVAEKTGVLDFQVFFNQYSSELLPAGGDLSIEVRDSTGDLISAMFGGATVGNNDASSIEDAGFVRASERVRFPAVAGQTYYLRVFGRNTAAANDTYAAANTVLNGYDLQILNYEPSVPYDLELNDIVQVGTVTVGTSSTQFTATIAPVNGVLPPTAFDYVGKTVEFTSGPNVGRFATISAFNSGTGVFTVTNAGSGLIATPTVGDTFLIETTDTGRSQLDNVTRDNTPIITFRLDDGIFLHDLPGNAANGTPPDEVIPIPFNPATGAAPVVGSGYRVAIYDEGAPQQAGGAPQTPIGYARPLAGVEGVYTFDFGTDAIGGPLVLSNGSHFLSAKVEIIDPATPGTFAYGARSQSLEIVVDAVTPPISFGDPAVSDDGLHPDSDSGDPSIPATLSDNITNDTTPTFFGRAEADAVVRLYIDRTNNGFTSDDLLLGQTVASPEDGTNQHPFGEWQVTSTINMNDPVLVATLGFDGIRHVFVTAEDPSGNISPIAAANTLQIFVDTSGPQVTGVFITDVPGYNLFSLKPGNVNQGPTPAVTSLTINIRDLPARQLGFLYQAISNVPPLAAVVLRGDHNGIIPIASITFTSDGNLTDNNPPVPPEPDPLLPGNPATGYITLTFNSPLPDDRFTLTLHDNIIDPVGNNLDGENNAAEPVANPTFPTGDDIPGGDFIARFTVDSRPEIATWSQGIVYVDINGNMVWDPEGQDNDYTNRDFIYNFGNITDAYFAGNFAPAGAVAASGFDKIGSYGAWNGVYQFFLDTDDDGVQDFVSNMPAGFQVNGIPVAGDFSAAHPGDEIGLYDGTAWYLDVNGNNVIDANERFATILRGIPFVGDFNGDGNDDLAVYHNDTGVFEFDLNRDHVTIEDRVVFGFSGFGERPVTGDMNLDGVDDLVLWVPGREGQLPKQSGEFHFLVSDDTITGVNPSSTRVRSVFSIEPGFDLASSEPAPAAFRPAPLGNDLAAMFGDEFALPILANFDPPVGDVVVTPPSGDSLTNPHNPLDVDGDGFVAPIDSLLVLNRLNQGAVDTSGPAIRTLAALNGWMMDTSGDGEVSPIDSLLVINYLNAQPTAGEGEAAEEPDAVWASAVDALFAADSTTEESGPGYAAPQPWSAACVQDSDKN